MGAEWEVTRAAGTTVGGSECAERGAAAAVWGVG